jgi:hypothetical protein
VNIVISSVVARATKSWRPGVLEQMQKQNTMRAYPSAVKSLSTAVGPRVGHFKGV